MFGVWAMVGVGVLTVALAVYQALHDFVFRRPRSWARPDERMVWQQLRSRVQLGELGGANDGVLAR